MTSVESTSVTVESTSTPVTVDPPKGDSEGWRIVINHPAQRSFSLPLCNMSYHIYGSLTRHVRDRHKGERVIWSFACSECGAQFDTKREVGVHYTRMHPGVSAETEERKGYHICEYRSKVFESSRGL